MVKEIQMWFIDKQVTAWGGMKLMKDMIDGIGIKEFMSRLELPHKGSNQGCDPHANHRMFLDKHLDRRM